MTAEQQEQRGPGSLETREHASRLREYRDRVHLRGRLILVHPGLPPYTNGHEQWYVFKTSEAVERWRQCQDRSARRMIEETRLK